MSPVDAVNRAVWSFGWAAGPTLLRPAVVRRSLGTLGAKIATRQPRHHLEQWRTNVTLATGLRPTDDDVAQAVSSYVRNVTESFVLPSWPAHRIVSSVTTDPVGEQHLREAMATRGAVVALPHIGSWDHAGAWACATGMPVSTVAEQLGDQEFAAFKRYRERLGFRIYSHRDPAALAGLCADASDGYLVCLVADRVFEGKGLEVAWPTGNGGTRPVLAPPGPAVVARRTGAMLIGCAAHFTRSGIHLAFSDPVELRRGYDGLVAMTQDLVTFFAGQVAASPTDWHVFQPFFSDGAT